MSLVTPIILGYVNKIKTEYSQDPNLVKEREEDAKVRARIEDEAIKANSSMCPLESARSYREHISSTNEDLIKKELGKQFYNFNVVKSASCNVGGIFLTLPQSKLTLQEAVNEYITNPKRVGSESAYGYAISAGIKGTPDMMIIKTSRRDSSRDLEHELFVALNGTNKMRGEFDNPNFAMVYIGFRCSKAVIDPNTKEVAEWCTPGVEGNVAYTIYENIAPAIQASDYTKTATANQILSMYLQVLLATQIGYEKIGWTHYDLHNENVLMRDPPKEIGNVFQIPYKIEGFDTIYLTTDKVVTFIDYGTATIKYGDRFIGDPRPFSDSMMIYQEACPISDAYKFLMFTIDELKNRLKAKPGDVECKKALGYLVTIFRFFNNKESVDYVLDKQWDYRYALPCTESYTLINLIKYVFTKFAPVLRNIATSVRNEKIRLLECKKCWTFDGLSKAVGGMNGRFEPRTLVEYYDVSGYLNSNDKLYFKYDEAKRISIRKLQDLIDNIKEVKLNVNSNDSEEKSKADHVKIFKISSLIDRISTYVKVFEWFYNDNQDIELDDMISYTDNELNRIYANFCRSVMKHMKNIETKGGKESWYKSPQVQEIYLLDTKICDEYDIDSNDTLSYASLGSNGKDTLSYASLGGKVNVNGYDKDNGSDTLSEDESSKNIGGSDSRRGSNIKNYNIMKQPESLFPTNRRIRFDDKGSLTIV